MSIIDWLTLLVFHSYSATDLTNTIDCVSDRLINNKEIIIVWDVVVVERANQMVVKVMVVVALAVVTV
jgi:hypothetical protein